MHLRHYSLRIFLSFCLVIVLSGLSASIIVQHKVEQSLTEELKFSAEETLDFLLQNLSQSDGLGLLRRLIKPIAYPGHSRLTLADLEGQVIADTAKDPHQMKNHLKRPEFTAALLGGLGTDQRLSQSTNQEMIYVAKKGQSNAQGFILRIAYPLRSLEDRRAGAQKLVLTHVFGALMGALLLSAWLTRRITKPLSLIDNAAKKLSQGDLKSRIPPLPSSELAPLAQTLNQLAEANEEHLRRHSRMDKIRSEFTSNISHELKTPLSSLKGYVELLESESIKEPLQIKKALKVMEKNINHMIALVQDLLKLAALENNEEKLALKAVDLEAIIEECLGRLRPQIEKKALRLHTYFEKKPFPPLRAHNNLLQPIIQNLVQNALIYTPDRGTINLLFYLSKDCAEIKISDSGIGIENKDLERIFERFYRVDTARSKDQGGTGLGLSIVKHCVIQLGGSIKVESTPGLGTSFNLSLPLMKEGPNSHRTYLS